MKALIISILILCYGIIATAQDTLILLDETAIGVKILKNTDTELYYHLWNDQNKNQRVINKKFVKEVKFQNGNSLVNYAESEKVVRTDLIVCRNGERLMAEVVDIGKENLIYRESGKEVNYIIPLEQVARVEYANGQVVNYEKDRIDKNSIITQNKVTETATDLVTETDVIGGDIDKNRLVGFVFGGKLGYFIPFNNALTEMYGAGFSYGFEAGWWGRNGFGWNLELRDFSRKGRITSDGDFSSTTFELMSLTTSLNYSFVEKGKFKTYAGIGLGVAFFSISDQSETIKDTLFEYFPYGGIYFKPMYIEARFVNASWEKTNMGGFELCFGIIF